jgi:hypothetical protein
VENAFPPSFFAVEAEDCNQLNRLEYIIVAHQGQLLCRYVQEQGDDGVFEITIVLENICKRIIM